MDNSIVDYLKARKQASNFQSRQVLWGQFDPGERYVGSAEQNDRLLAALKLGEVAPELEFVSQVIPIDGEIHARILSDSSVLIENGLSLTSSNSEPLETVVLGTANRFGLIPLHIRNQHASSLGQLVLLPHNGQVRVDWWAVPTETTEESFIIKVDDPSLAELVEQFFNHFGDVSVEAAKRASEEFLEAASVSGMLFDVFMGAAVVLISGGGASVVIVPQVAQYGLDFSAKFIEHAVQLASQPSDQSDKDTLKALLTAPLTVARVGLSIVNARRAGKEINSTILKKNHRLCQSIVELNSLGGWSVDHYDVPADDEKQLRAAGNVLRSGIGNLISVVCAAQPKK